MLLIVFACFILFAAMFNGYMGRSPFEGLEASVLTLITLNVVALTIYR